MDELRLSGDPVRDAAALFSLGPCVVAVLLESDLPATAKYRKRLKPAESRRASERHDEIVAAVRSGDLAHAQAIASEPAPRAPQITWWIGSQAELSERLAAMRSSASRRRMALGWNAELITEHVALFQLWWD